MFYLYFAISQKTLIFVYITNLIYIMVYVILAEGFEEIEALTVVDVVRRAGVEVCMVSITSEKEVKGAHGIVVAADVLLPNTDLAASELVVLPGGMPGAENLNVGEKAYLSNAYGQPFPVMVTAKDDTTITFDANHEMAGKELNFRIELVEVQ